MYSLALIIFVVSEKKAFEHFPIGSNVNLCITVAAILDFWKVLYKVYDFYIDRKSKMAATVIHRLTLDPMGKCSNAFFSETTIIIKAKLYGGGHLGFPIGIKNIKFVEDLPRSDARRVGFVCSCRCRAEAFISRHRRDKRILVIRSRI
jgi:hypothetical protein